MKQVCLIWQSKVYLLTDFIFDTYYMVLYMETICMTWRHYEEK